MAHYLEHNMIIIQRPNGDYHLKELQQAAQLYKRDEEILKLKFL